MCCMCVLSMSDWYEGETLAYYFRALAQKIIVLSNSSMLTMRLIILLCHSTSTIQLSKNFVTVTVSQPWEDYTYIPEGSIALVKCTADMARAPAWTIFLGGNETNPVGLQFTFNVSINSLNKRGFYQVPSDVDGTILLKVNVTEGINNNNGTEILCVYPGEATTISKTVLIVYGESRQVLPSTLIQFRLRFHSRTAGCRSGSS